MISDCFRLPDGRLTSQFAGVDSSDSQTDNGGMLQRHVPTSKPQTSHRAKDKSRHNTQDIQSNQLQRAVVLGPPGTPQRGRSPEQKEDQLKKLEQRLEQLAVMLDMLKAQV